MTAEVIVMNRDAVALAADSAATITEKKIFNTVNKVFALSKHNPVGVMIYGTAEINQVPWEPIIKSYRKVLGESSFNTLEEYVNHFFGYFNSLQLYFPEDTQEFQVSSIAYYVFDNVNTDLIQALRSNITDKGSEPDVTELMSIIDSIIHGHYNEYITGDNLEYFSDREILRIYRRYKRVIEAQIDHVFQELPLLSRQRHKLRKMCIYALVKNRSIHGHGSGIVFTGFGEKEMFPSFYSYNIKGFIADRIIYIKDYESKITHSSRASIRPFAQSDMVHLFMQGVDPAYQRIINSYISELIEHYPKIVVDAICDKCPNVETNSIISKLRDAGEEIVEKLKEEFAHYRRETHINPVLDVVSLLPKDELAAMAESLVNLTCRKRRMSFDAETVGGPIDVAIISKGDGFVWIKRKHYFQPEFNHGFFQNYFKK